MEHRDPHALIAEAAAALRRRHAWNALAPWLPGAAVLAAFAILERLPVELAAAAAIAAVTLAAHLLAAGPDARGAAALLDERIAGRDHFLTLATAELAPPMRELVESGAARLAEGVRIEDVPPPVAWRGIARGGIAAGFLALLLAVSPADFPPAAGPAERLEEIAAELEKEDGGAGGALARELRAVAAVLRDPASSATERREAVERALEKLESGEKGSGSEEGGVEEGAGGDRAGELRGEARSALEDAASSRDGESSEGGDGTGSGEKGSNETQGSEESGGEAAGQQPGATGGGVEAPRPDPSGVKEREADGSDGENRPDDSPAKSRESKGGEGEGREPRDPNRPGPGEAKGPDPSGGAGGAGGAPSPSNAEGPENPDLPGEGPGWRIVDGRYVRVRVPEGENEALETERVRGPGEVEPVTPWSNAPLPGEGPSGEPVERQPLPLEYRGVLKQSSR